MTPAVREILDPRFWRTPHRARQFITALELAILTREGGEILAQGKSWLIRARKMAPTVYTVWLEVKK